MTPKNLKPEELQKVKTLEALVSQNLQELGIACYDEVAARSRVVEITEQLNQAAQEKNEYYNQLREIYGDGTIDLSEGTFLPAAVESAE